MRMHWRGKLLIALLGFLLPGQAAHACQFQVLDGIRWPGATYLLVSGLPDSVAARGEAGQLARVRAVVGERLAPSDSVVLVFWDDDESCRPIRYRSVAYLAPDHEMVIVASRRPSERWVGGLETFDVYHAGVQGLVTMLSSEGELLTHEQMSPAALLEFIRAWPTPEEIDQQLIPTPRTRSWAREHPALLRHPTVRAVLAAQCGAQQDAHVRGLRLPISGTYAVVITAGGQNLSTGEFTTSRAPSGVSHYPNDGAIGPSGECPSTVGTIEWTLWGGAAASDSAFAGRGALVTRLRAAARPDGGEEWDAEIDPGFVRGMMLRNGVRGAGPLVLFDEPWRACGPDAPGQLGGAIVRLDQRVEVRQRYCLRSGQQIELAGIRLVETR